jgi:membrane protein DedA with SNARE-associated domain
VIPYLTIVLFAVLEGEIYYSKVCADAMVGKLNWIGVWCAGAIGGSLGDQIWFYLLRGRIHCRVGTHRPANQRDRVSAHVQAHEALIILAGRFLPGLRTAIPVACAYADVPALKFSTLNLVSGFAWAGSIMLFVKLGSNALTAFGLNAWWGPLIPALFVVLFFRWLSLPKRVIIRLTRPADPDVDVFTVR